MPRRKHELMLPVQPFSDWLSHLCAVHGDAYTAEMTGLAERQLWRYKRLIEHSHGRRRPIRHVSLSIVDRSLIHADTDLLLQDLYPELYEGTAA